MSDPILEEEARHAFARDKINELLPRLMYLKAEFRKNMNREPDAVMLPWQLNPGRYEGEGATDVEASIMGLPVVWGNRVGLVFN